MPANERRSDRRKRGASTQRPLTEQATDGGGAVQATILNTAAHGIITIDERGIVESFNPAAERLFDYRAEEVLGRNVTMLMPSPHREQHDAHLADYLRTGNRRIIGIGRSVMARRKDGVLFPIHLGVSEAWFGDRRIFLGSFTT